MLSHTVKGFNFTMLKVRGFLDGTFRGGFNFADYSIASYNLQTDNYRPKRCKMIAVVLISRENCRPRT